MTTLRGFILNQIIKDLRGTCQSLEDVAAYYHAGELSVEDLFYIEEEIFLCNGCGWWCDRSEEVYDNICEGCADEENDNE